MRLFLIHWNENERQECIPFLEEAGYEVICDLPKGPGFTRVVEEKAPTAMLIDLSRLPSNGREVAVMLRTRKSTRSIPILFLGGEPGKAAAIKDLLPDAVFTDWEHILSELSVVLSSPPKEYAALDSVFAAYTDRPLASKLGIKPGSKVCLMGAPRSLIAKMGELPEGAAIVESENQFANLFVWFLSSVDEMERKMDQLVESSRNAPTWIAWPKKTAGQVSDLNQVVVRKLAMRAGMVDYKICSIDEKWSALLFKWRGIDQ